MKKEIEVWLDYNDLIKVSNLGNIIAKSRILNSVMSNSGTRTTNEKIKSKLIDTKGYYRICINVNKKRYQYRVHRVVASAFIPNPENKPYINHINGIKTDNRVENLEWCTPKENTKHALEYNLIAKGEKCIKHKLTDINIIAIRRLYKINPKFNRTLIAEKLNVKSAIISKIIYNQRRV